MLSDTEIRAEVRGGGLVVRPALRDEQYQPASLDLTLGGEFARYTPEDGKAVMVDPRRGAPNPAMTTVGPGPDGAFYLFPKEFCLATTAEWVRLAPHLGARIEGKSSVGRRGLAVHITAGFVDPGFFGFITLELYNFTPYAIRLTPGMPICQLALERMVGEVARPYGSPGLGSRYQGQPSVTPAK